MSVAGGWAGVVKSGDGAERDLPGMRLWEPGGRIMTLGTLASRAFVSVLSIAAVASAGACGRDEDDGGPGAASVGGGGDEGASGGRTPSSNAAGAQGDGASRSSGGSSADAGGPSEATGEVPSGDGGTTAGGSPASTGGGMSASGGSASQAGSTTGTGGSGIPEPEVGTVGEQCSEPGALSCAGTYQRVITICGGDGTWEPLETCPVGQFCDTRPGATIGSCQDPHPDCVDRQPGERFCVAEDVYACGPDAITTHLVDDCPQFCIDAQCVEAELCPTGTDWVNCSQDCTGVEYACFPETQGSFEDCPYYPRPETRDWSTIGAIRSPAAADACACTSNSRHFFRILDSSAEDYLKVTVKPPWGIVYPLQVGVCSDAEVGQCVVAASAAWRDIVVTTTDATAPPTNVTFEVVTAEETCP